ncbi:hypothetical protein KEN51_CDS0020 [Pseudomonas phage vB_Pae10145-KEN51]|uniref:Uncharacterized protein n=3 Tax=Phikzvirus TaxID=680115 RepID=I7DAB5_9CAUD|nr:hypothetical protein FDI90_gp019 [Pseudomonas phage PA7]ANM44777.1 hypothetical protein KTN4_019 [Pseudomonas phage KTN4]MCT4994232.1 hypothetical protein [Pseudomonas aeruginosa]QGK90016.1 hypothetical protein [Pseudomonas phage vB_PA32_GUMS]QJB22662.1 hypothetical protein fnug_19 [Pseudomonas phage fnug]QOV07873.1 hypothetical protein [Pseudomonas phage vB_PaeM_kmuB]QYV99049.1 hypothetical protein [Pseudomonas phage T2P]QYV99183.1 hypothetical protein [Pseudomonas phage U1B]QYV99638.1 
MVGYRIIAFNGTQWESPSGYTIQQAVNEFLKKYDLHELDIRSITALH